MLPQLFEGGAIECPEPQLKVCFHIHLSMALLKAQRDLRGPCGSNGYHIQLTVALLKNHGGGRHTPTCVALLKLLEVAIRIYGRQFTLLNSLECGLIEA
jgi:hypothetical protein